MANTLHGRLMSLTSVKSRRDLLTPVAGVPGAVSVDGAIDTPGAKSEVAEVGGAEDELDDKDVNVEGEEIGDEDVQASEDAEDELDEKDVIIESEEVGDEDVQASEDAKGDAEVHNPELGDTDEWAGKTAASFTGADLCELLACPPPANSSRPLPPFPLPFGYPLRLAAM